MASESRKSDKPEDVTLEVFLKYLQSHNYSPKDIELINKSYKFSEKAHENQLRRSGEPYIVHPLNVSYILASIGLDMPTIATGLLHDTVEDTKVTLKDIEENFGPQVALLVDGVTKISQMTFKNTHAKQAENIRKMIVAMGKDIRVVLVKLADRLHNMRTLNHMPFAKQTRIAQETLDIYAPLAHRLGISAWKSELEDLSLRYLKPDIFYDLVQRVAKKKNERETYIDEVKAILLTEMRKAKLEPEIQGRPKHLYSIYKKMTNKNIDYDQVHDVLAFRIIVDNVAQCYEVLGIVHTLYKPIPGRFKDFIAMPKANNYQSLHTTVIGPYGERVEIQIRTEEMHLVAERGVAAHWSYKEGQASAGQVEQQKFDWLRNLVDWNHEVGDPDEFLESVKSDLFESEIYVFTPKGDVKELPEGGTALDFSYAIHTDVGHKTVGVKVNGRMVPFKTKLKNGDTVEILTSNNQKPSKDWLKYCITSRAQSKIRAFVRSEERERSITLGRDLIEREFRKYGLNSNKYIEGDEFDKFLRDTGISDQAEFFAQVAYGKIMPIKAVERLAPETKNQKLKEEESFFEKVFKKAVRKKKKQSSLIRVDGMTDLLVRYAQCCNPIPGDPIVGFISRGRGVTIHQASCPKIFEIDLARRVDVEWTQTQSGPPRLTKVQVVCQDIPGLLTKISESFSANGANIHKAQIHSTKDKKSICKFDVEVKDTQQILNVLQALQKIKGIIRAERINYS